MGECLFQANGLNNEENFRCDEIDDTQGTCQLEQHRPQKSIQKYTIDVVGNLNSEKRLRNDRDIVVVDAQISRNQLPEKPPTEKGRWRWLYESAKIGMTRIAALLNYEEHEVQRTSLMEDQGRNDTPIVNKECDDPPRLMDEDEERGSISQSKKIAQCSTRIETGVRTKEGEVVKLGPLSRKYHTQIVHRDRSSCNLSSAEAQDTYEDNMYTYAEIVEAVEARILAALDVQEVEARLHLDREWHWLDPSSSPNEQDEAEDSVSSMEMLMKEMDEYTEMRIQNSTQVIPETERMEAPSSNEEELRLPPNYKYRSIDTFFVTRIKEKENRPSTNGIVAEPKTIIEMSTKATTVMKGTRKKNVRTCGYRWSNRTMKTRQMKTKTIFEDSFGYRQLITTLICNRLCMVRKIGYALEMIALLRRCLYPERDVIRWYV